MKITHNAPDLLIIDSKPWPVRIILVGMVLVVVGYGLETFLNGDTFTGLMTVLLGGGIGGLFIAIFVRRNQLVLDRRDNRLELRRRTLFRHTRVRHDLRHLRRAIVETARGDKKDTHRMTLELTGGMDAGLHPFTEVYTSGRGAQRAADAVNGWLALRPVDSAPPTP